MKKYTYSKIINVSPITEYNTSQAITKNETHANIKKNKYLNNLCIMVKILQIIFSNASSWTKDYYMDINFTEVLEVDHQCACWWLGT